MEMCEICARARALAIHPKDPYDCTAIRIRNNEAVLNFTGKHDHVAINRYTFENGRPQAKAAKRFVTMTATQQLYGCVSWSASAAR